jgi:hypothetical protein
VQGFPEESKRRTGWIPGVPVILADGQEWHLRRPELELSPAMADGQVVGINAGLDGVEDYERMVSILEGETRVDVAELWRVRFEAAVVMLRPNYDLTDRELYGLLSVRPNLIEGEGRYAIIVEAFLQRKG